MDAGATGGRRNATAKAKRFMAAPIKSVNSCRRACRRLSTNALRASAFSLPALSRDKLGQRPGRLAHQDLGVTPRDEVAQLAHGLVAQTLVERARSRIERRHAQEDVRAVAQNSLFGEPDQRASDAAPAPFLAHGNRLDVAGERAPHREKYEAHDVTVGDRDVALERGILHGGETAIV